MVISFMKTTALFSNNLLKRGRRKRSKESNLQSNEILLNNAITIVKIIEQNCTESEVWYQRGIYNCRAVEAIIFYYWGNFHPFQSLNHGLTID